MQAPEPHDLVQLPVSRRQSRMVEASLLLLLLEREGAYGYELTQELDRLGLTEATVEAAAVYRTLRWLEQQEHVRSRWDTTGDGPARRRYELTDLGYKSVVLWADLLKHRKAAFERYLDRYAKAIARARRYRRI